MPGKVYSSESPINQLREVWSSDTCPVVPKGSWCYDGMHLPLRRPGLLLLRRLREPSRKGKTWFAKSQGCGVDQFLATAASSSSRERAGRGHRRKDWRTYFWGSKAISYHSKSHCLWAQESWIRNIWHTFPFNHTQFEKSRRITSKEHLEATQSPGTETQQLHWGRGMKAGGTDALQT